MAKPVQLSNGRLWPSRKDAHAHFKEMLARYEDGDEVTDSSDESDLRALIELYDSVLPPGSVTKTGVGIRGFSRELNKGEGYSSSGFHVHRLDGSSIDFGLKYAVYTDAPRA